MLVDNSKPRMEVNMRSKCHLAGLVSSVFFFMMFGLCILTDVSCHGIHLIVFLVPTKSSISLLQLDCLGIVWLFIHTCTHAHTHLLIYHNVECQL